MFINHNMPALRTNGQLKINTNLMNNSLSKLSSGFRINKAADDAAGMAIARKMKTQIAGLDQASRNASDGISVIQSAEGALTEVQSMLQRMRELSVQAANDTLTEDDRLSIQDEINQLREEIDRISTDTEFNTKSLLDGSLDRKTYTNDVGTKIFSINDVVDAGDYEITVGRNPRQALFNGSASAGFTGVGGVVDGAEAGTVVINGESLEIKEGQTYAEVIKEIQNICSNQNIDMVSSTGTDFDKPGTSYDFITKDYGRDASISINVDNPNLANALGIPVAGGGAFGVDGEIDSTSGFSDSATITYKDKYAVISDHTGFEMKIDISNSAVGAAIDLSVFEAGPMVLQIGANENQTVAITIPEVSAKSLEITDVKVVSQTEAEKAITKFDTAVNRVSGIRAKLGAYQNRLESSVSNLDSSSLSVTEALSRIEDVDMAEEMTKYTQYQVLVQASTSMLSQANQQPQTVLSLLQS